MRPRKAKETKELQGVQLTSAATFILDNFAVSQHEKVSGNWTFYWQKTIAVDRMLLVVLGLKHTWHVPLWVFIRKESNI